MNQLHRSAFEREIALARDLMREGRNDEAFAHLERAHVLGQQHVLPHVLSHWLMLTIALRRGQLLAVLGQACRLVLGALGSAVGIVPTGNTGGTNVGMFKKMPIDPGLADIIRSSAKSVNLRDRN